MPLDAPQLNNLIYLLDRLDNQIRVELDLIGQRMTALCISQSFMFSAFATAANGPRGNIQAALIFWLPLLGITIATILEASIGAAIYAIWDRKRDREIVRQKVKHEFSLGGLNSSYFEDIPGSAHFEMLAHVSASDIPHKLGNYWTLALAPSLAVVWIILFVQGVIRT